MKHDERDAEYESGAPCPEAQADGVPCPTLDGDCETCEKAEPPEEERPPEKARPPDRGDSVDWATWPEESGESTAPEDRIWGGNAPEPLV
jgi:hypothetical protein